MRGRSALAATVALAAWLTGCAGDGPADRAGELASSRPPSTSSSTREVPSPGGSSGPPVPARTAGDLDQHSVPAALDLGPGWRQYVDPGNPAEGYAGNGSWVRARGVGEVVQGVVPLGCSRLVAPPRLPVPGHALEATYRGPGDAPGVALVLDYGSAAAAGRFVSGMARIARSCPEPARPVGRHDPLTVVVTPLRVDRSTVLDRRRELGAGASGWVWSEAVVRARDRVGLLIVASGPGAARPDLAALSARLRAAIPR